MNVSRDSLYKALRLGGVSVRMIFSKSAPQSEEYRQVAIARFMKFVSPEPNSGCWLWTGSAGANGDGLDPRPKFGFGNKVVRAARVSLWLFRKIDLGNQWALHSCDNGMCVNPDHLFPGSAADNTADMVRKGRQYNGHRKTKGRPAGSPNSCVPGFTKRRVELGLTARAVAERITALGVHTKAQAVSRWERGLCLPSVGRIAALAEVLGVSEDAAERMFYGVRHA